MIRIVLLAALPQEYRPLIAKTKHWKPIPADGPFRLWRRQSREMDALIVETGMGGGGIPGAVRLALRLGFSDLLLSVGFAGSLSEGIGVGRVVLGGRFLTFPSESALGPPAMGAMLSLPDAGRVDAFCAGMGIPRVRVVTVDRPRPKTELHGYFADMPTIVDMESAIVAAEAFRGGIPFLCLRSVSDALDDEFDFDPAEISDASGKIRIGKVLGAIAGRPGLIRSFYSSWRRSAPAAHRLGGVLAALLDFTPADLKLLAGESYLQRGG